MLADLPAVGACSSPFVKLTTWRWRLAGDASTWPAAREHLRARVDCSEMAISSPSDGYWAGTDDRRCGRPRREWRTAAHFRGSGGFVGYFSAALWSWRRRRRHQLILLGAAPRRPAPPAAQRCATINVRCGHPDLVLQRSRRLDAVGCPASEWAPHFEIPADRADARRTPASPPSPPRTRLPERSRRLRPPGSLGDACRELGDLPAGDGEGDLLMIPPDEAGRARRRRYRTGRPGHSRPVVSEGLGFGGPPVPCRDGGAPAFSDFTGVLPA